MSNMTRVAPTWIACPRCGEPMLTGYKHRPGLAKCSACRSEASIRQAERAQAEARTKRAEAIREVWALEAGQLRAEAASKRAEAAEITERVSGLVAQLRDLTGCEYVADPTPRLRNVGEPNRIMTMQVRAVDLPRHAMLL